MIFHGVFIVHTARLCYAEYSDRGYNNKGGITIRWDKWNTYKNGNIDIDHRYNDDENLFPGTYGFDYERKEWWQLW